MCQTNVARIKEIKGNKAMAEFLGREIELSTEFFNNVKKGDDVIFSSGLIIEKISKESAKSIRSGGCGLS